MHSEVLIIGGGVIGLSIARELHKRGVRRITLVEKGRCGEEASWAAAGMLSPQIETDEGGEFFDLCCVSRDLYPTFAAELLAETGVDINLDRTGTLYLAFNNGEADLARTRFEWQRQAHLPVEHLLPGDVRSLEPALSHDIHEALYFPNDWQVENRKLLSALRAYAALNGIEIFEGSKVERLYLDGSICRGAETEASKFFAETTVVATGAWTSLIKLGDVGMPFTIEPVRGQIVEFRPDEKLLRHVICTKAGYLVPRIDGRILAGSTSERVGFDESVTALAASRLGGMARAILPQLAGFEIADQWAGLRPVALDGLPVLGPLGGVENVFIAAGHYRNGILLAPVTAKLLADRLVGSTDSVLAFFEPDRFPVRGVGMGR